MTNVRFEDWPTAGGRRFGIATLDALPSLNALSLSMVRALLAMFRQWAASLDVVGVVLQGAGDRAFCAGGDVRELNASLRASPGEPSAYARAFFAEEYELDYLIHSFEKPILCWGHGIVMGGGIGLMAGASHRVVTSQSRLAMPEITIGLYPDVGASWLFRRMPGRVGLFLALTGAQLNAADALFCGLADVHSTAAARADVLEAIKTSNWTDSSHHEELSRILAQSEVPELPDSNVRRHFDLLNELMAGDNLADIDRRLRGFNSEDPWLATAATTFSKGSPTSAALIFELWQRAEHLSLADAFRMDYDVSLGCMAHVDFVEGVRALLIEKDKKPRWSPATLAEIDAALIEDHFRPRWAGSHPLAALLADRARHALRTTST